MLYTCEVTFREDDVKTKNGNQGHIVQGWGIGSEGFSPNNTVPTLLAIILVLAWRIWLLFIAWRMKEPVKAPTG